MSQLAQKQRPSPASPAHVLHGLSLPAITLKALQRRGVYCLSGITLEHQSIAGRYVLRGIESGGAVADMGRACAYVAEEGCPLPWLQSIDSIAVNGRHAIFLACNLVRIEMFRMVRTYQLAISHHALSFSPGRARPEIRSTMLFRGMDGALPLDLWKTEHKEVRGQLAPVFYSRGGEMIAVPSQFEGAIRKITGMVCCIGCRHTHVGVPPIQNGGKA